MIDYDVELKSVVATVSYFLIFYLATNCSVIDLRLGSIFEKGTFSLNIVKCEADSACQISGS